MILGLTGGYCAGKSTVANILKEKGFEIVDVDKCGHLALNEAIDEVEKLLGPSVKNSDGSPNRKQIGSIVFANQALLGLYEKIIHPVMNKITMDKIYQFTKIGKDVCIDAALLYTLPCVKSCDKIIEVQASQEIRLQRALERDNNSKDKAKSRIEAQEYLWETGKTYKNITEIVQNNGDYNNLLESVEKIINK